MVLTSVHEISPVDKSPTTTPRVLLSCCCPPPSAPAPVSYLPQNQQIAQSALDVLEHAADEVSTIHLVKNGAIYPRTANAIRLGKAAANAIGLGKGDDGVSLRKGEEGTCKGSECDGKYDEQTFHDWNILRLELDVLPVIPRIVKACMKLDVCNWFTFDDKVKAKFEVWENKKSFYLLMAYLQVQFTEGHRRVTDRERERARESERERERERENTCDRQHVHGSNRGCCQSSRYHS